ncbi:MAG: GNAT family N-acetyltransferase [Akkermansiaceae bacterium]|nr:GNAT family N-acetyltransferase [Akkermansiaceae bacterium]
MQDYFDEIGIEREYPIILLGKISVSQGQQDQGIGTRLLKDLEEIAREKSVTLIFLKVGWPSNENNKEVRTKNMHFYKKSGYDMVEPVNKRSPSYKLAPFAFKEMA